MPYTNVAFPPPKKKKVSKGNTILSHSWEGCFT